MSQILAMMRKELTLWAQKPGSWIVIFIVPLLFIWIMQAVFGSSGTPVVTIYAVNEDESLESKRIMEALRQADNLELNVLATRSEADRLVGMGERMAAVIIPEGFGSSLTTSHGARIDIIIDPARSEQANIVVGLLNSALGPFIIEAEVNRSVEASVGQIIDVAELQPTKEITPEPTLEVTLEPSLEPTIQETIEPDPTFDGTSEDFYPGLDLTSEPTLDFSELVEPTPGTTATVIGGENQGGGQNNPEATLRLFFIAAVNGVVSNQVQESLDNPQVRLAEKAVTENQNTRRPSLLDYLVPGYSLMFMYFLISNLAQTVVEERESGTLRRLLSAPVPRSRILLGKLLTYFLIAVAQMIFVFLIAKFFFHLDLGGAPGALGVVIVASALAMAGLGILIGALAKTEAQANGLAMMIVLAMAVISGAMFPSIFIPGLQSITPHYWSLQGFLNVISRGQGIEGVVRPTGILLTMAAVFFTIGAIRFRFE